ncbi:MAG: biotin--[acetyl-CoA-carboxylase] ligase [Deltaproteobacteria bacterium]|nr:biotin--[acetyl-CoA-carboxylase] ligase [Deltaproteobacteria bacterium]
MDITRIKKNLKTAWLGKTIHFESSIDSTNAWGLRGIDAGSKRGEVFLADYQTKGRGRQNRVWESSAGKNILMTLIDNAPADPAKVFQLTLVAGVAFQEALSSLFPSLPIRLKWPNDLLLKGKKLAGILCEKHPSKPMAVVGVGINANAAKEDFTAETAGIAASLALELGGAVEQEQIAASCLNSYEKWREKYDQSGLAPASEAWLKKTDMMGKKVRVVDGGKTFEGTAQSLDEDGFLVVDGKKIISGDIVLCF